MVVAACPNCSSLDRKAVQRGIADRHALPHEQFANLGEPQPFRQPVFNRRAMFDTTRPALATGTSAARLQRQQDVADLLVTERLQRSSQPRRFCRTQIPAHRLWIEAQLGGDPLLRHPRLPEPKDFPELDHRDLAIHPRLLPGLGQNRRPLSRDQARGKGFEKVPPQGGKGFEKMLRKGSLGSEN